MMRRRDKAILLAGLLVAASVPGTAPVAAQTTSRSPTATRSPEPQPSLDPFQERALRAQANLEALIAGRLSTSQLSQQELQDVLDFERMVRGAARSDTRSVAQRCFDEEVRRNGGNPTRLALEVIRLKCR